MSHPDEARTFVGRPLERPGSRRTEVPLDGAPAEPARATADARDFQFGSQRAPNTRQSSAVLTPVPPIVADEHGDVILFRSLADAEKYIEPVDVENDEYKFYDAKGLQLTGEVRKVREPGGWLDRLFHPPFDQTKLFAAPGAQHVPDELASVLRSYLARVGANRTGVADEQLPGMGLEDLVLAATEFQDS